MKTQILPLFNLTSAQLAHVTDCLAKGATAALATDTVYGLATGAFCEQSIQSIYALKERPATMPLQLLVASVTQAKQIANLSEPVCRLANVFWPGGLTLIVPPSEAGKPLLRGFSGLGIRVPALEPLQRVLTKMSMPLACTSANLHGQAVLTCQEDVINQYNGKIDFILAGGTLSPTPSSVLDVTKQPAQLLREGTISKEELTRVYGGVIV